MSHQWIGDAEYVFEGLYLGECDNGDLWIPIAHGFPGLRGSTVTWRRFSRWNLRHRMMYARSRRAGRVVMLERAS